MAVDKGTVALEGAPNFRALAGCETADGRKVVAGRLYRSGALAELTDQDLERVADLGIGIVCDLRGPDERRRDPHRWPKGVPLETIAHGAGGDMAAVKVSQWRERLVDPNFGAEQARQWMIQAYTRMPTAYAGDLATLFTRLDAPTHPSVMVNCAAGKDRTGFFCSMLLSALGVRWDAIIEDYLESGRRRSPEDIARDVIRRYFKPGQDCSIDALHVIASVNVDFLNTAFTAINDRFGSVDAYLESACGLDGARRARLRESLLEA